MAYELLEVEKMMEEKSVCFVSRVVPMRVSEQPDGG